MAATPTGKPILHAIVPRIAVGNAQQTQAFYGRIGFACTHQEEGFMIVERDGVQLHLHPSNEPPTGHWAFWIRVSNIEALYQEYSAVGVITSSKVKPQPWGFKEFHICDPFRNIFIFAESLTEQYPSGESIFHR
jgi:Glyoxalase/Bleomycin resistance protein/Dioxygenase superfamily